jgi:hypothetical protein
MDFTYSQWTGIACNLIGQMTCGAYEVENNKWEQENESLKWSLELATGMTQPRVFIIPINKTTKW